MLGIKGFKASNGWLERYSRRSSVQPSYKLKGKRNDTHPPCHTSRMVEMRSAASQYEPRNIWNIDESGSFFAWDPTVPTCLLPTPEWKYVELNLDIQRSSNNRVGM